VSAPVAFADVSGILWPRSVAIVGASDRPGNLGGDTVRHLLKFGYPGAVWPVNPQQAHVAGIPCYPSPGQLPGTAELAVLAVSAGAMLDAIRECRAAGIRHGIAFAGGFAEAGATASPSRARWSSSAGRPGSRCAGPTASA
jgi:acyl-CoA synthetase (NDP forming)